MQISIPKNYFQLAAGYLKSHATWVAEHDQYGNPLETELNILYADENEIAEASRDLPENFPPEEAGEEADCETGNAHNLGYLTDFSKIREFGIDGAGCQFCMDFSVGEEPRVIFGDDGELSWRVLADTLEDFFALFHEEE